MHMDESFMLNQIGRWGRGQIYLFTQIHSFSRAEKVEQFARGSSSIHYGTQGTALQATHTHS